MKFTFDKSKRSQVKCTRICKQVPLIHHLIDVNCGQVRNEHFFCVKIIHFTYSNHNAFKKVNFPVFKFNNCFVSLL